MTYRVEWLEPASQVVLEALAQAPQELHDQILHAVNELDHVLEMVPHETGESRTGRDDRIVIESPLAVRIHISDRQALVRITTANVHRPKT